MFDKLSGVTASERIDPQIAEYITNPEIHQVVETAKLRQDVQGMLDESRTANQLTKATHMLTMKLLWATVGLLVLTAVVAVVAILQI